MRSHNPEPFRRIWLVRGFAICLAIASMFSQKEARADITYSVNSAQSQLTISATLLVNFGAQTIHMPFQSITSPANSLQTSLTGSFTANNPTLGLSIPSLHIAQVTDLNARVINPIGSPILFPAPGTQIGTAGIDVDNPLSRLRFSMNGNTLLVSALVNYSSTGLGSGQIAITNGTMNVVGAPVFSSGDNVVDFDFGTGATPLRFPGTNPAIALEISVSGHVQGVAVQSAPEPATVGVWLLAGAGLGLVRSRRFIGSRLKWRSVRHHRGVTLVELLAVMLIVGILVALLIPAVLTVRESSRKHACSNNLRQIGMALHQFHSAKNQLPAGRNAQARHQHCWATSILMFADYESLYHQYQFGSAWNSPANAKVVQTDVPLYICPSAEHRETGNGDYAGNYGSSLSGLKPGFGIGKAWTAGTLITVNLAKAPAKAVALDQIRDGCSQTLLVVEDAAAPGLGGKWACGHHNVSHDHGPINSQRSLQIFSDHSHGANCLFSDGAVKFLSDDVALKVIGAISTRSQHEKLTAKDQF